MANILDRYFEHNLSQLPKDSPNDIPNWDNFPEDDSNEIEEGKENYDIERIETYQDHINTSNIINKIRESNQIFKPSDEENELIEGGIRVRGFEAIAFYKSKRFIDKSPCKGMWGIFYIREGLDKLAWDISKYYPSYGDPYKLAHKFLFEHEHYHFQSDIQVLIFEVLLKKNLYLPLRRALKRRKSHFIEEALANKRAYEWAKKPNIGLREFSFDFMSLQPNAYSRFDEPRDTLSGEWLSNVIDLLPPYSPPRQDLISWVGTIPSDLMRRSLCPEYVIYPKILQNWIDPTWIPPRVNKIVEIPKVLKKLQDPKESFLAKKWESTKSKLIEDRFSPGLGFKPWPNDGPNVYSVKVDSGFRVHIENQGSGLWAAIKIDNHKEMGHG